MPADLPVTVIVATPAKVNLHLGVGARRPDGFHDLVSVFHAVGLCDEVSATSNESTTLRIEGGSHRGGVPTDRGNLAWRAADLLASTAGVRADVALRLRKDIPVAGGMAGGSADAAGTLVACSALWDVRADLPVLAAELGSDVPFALLGGTALGTGRGEVLEPIPTAAELHWVFAFAEAGISAGAAYCELDRLRDTGSAPPPIGPPNELVDALATGDVPAIAVRLANDLQPAAISLRPSLQATLDLGVAAGALAGIVSGSGPTCAFLCAEPSAAQVVRDGLRAHGHRATVATGPTRGATII